MSAVPLSAQAPDAAVTAPRPRVRAMLMDQWLLGVALALLVLGVVMVGSASITMADRQTGQPFHFLVRQAVYAAAGLLLAWSVLRIRLVYWEKAGPVLLLVSLLLLVLVLVPGLGKQVNGAKRWLNLGLFAPQVSEFTKLFIVVYLAGYVVRRGAEVRSSITGFLKPMAVLALAAVLLLLEPDFGATAVLLATALGMMFLGGVRLWLFGVLLSLILAVLGVLALTSPYRLQRLTTFLDPWADPFNTGFQLTQALIAIGRGEWFGVGLGASVQKLFYLPEAHTDFLFAVLAEELGLAGGLAVIAAFGFVVWRAFQIGAAAERSGNLFGGYLAYGLGLWIGLQAFVNIGVNMGILPTKGLTLPLISYGGSSMLVMCVAFALLLRVDMERRLLHKGATTAGGVE